MYWISNICHQVCTNTEGSFTCGCEAGYVLDSDRASCSGTAYAIICYVLFGRIIYTHTAVGCGTPPSITNGSPGIPTTTTFAGKVTYSCNDGYSLFGIATSTCQANATWSKSPECRGVCFNTFTICIQVLLCYVVC